MSTFFLHTYQEENENWEKTLIVQRMEVPVMGSELLHSSLSHQKELQRINARDLKTLLEQKAIEIDQILLKIQKQQLRIQDIKEQQPGQISLIDLLYHQEDLRDEVLGFEQEYLGFKQRVRQFFLSAI